MLVNASCMNQYCRNDPSSASTSPCNTAVRSIAPTVMMAPSVAMLPNESAESTRYLRMAAAGREAACVCGLAVPRAVGQLGSGGAHQMVMAVKASM
jgi:hypothetical protein